MQVEATNRNVEAEQGDREVFLTAASSDSRPVAISLFQQVGESITEATCWKTTPRRGFSSGDNTRYASYRLVAI